MAYEYDHEYFRQELIPQHSSERCHSHGQKSPEVPCPEVNRQCNLILSK